MILRLLLWIDTRITRCRIGLVCDAIDREAVRGMLPVVPCPCSRDPCECVTDDPARIAH